MLNRARRFAVFGSLVPSNRSYMRQMRVYAGNTLRAGLSHMHGLRHAYAQNRYEELTGWRPRLLACRKEALTQTQRETPTGTRSP